MAFLIGGFSLFKFIQKTTTENKVEAFLKEKGYTEAILEQETRYDSKTGDYYVQVIYKGEPN